MKFYNLAGGSNPRRVRIFLAEAGIEVPIVDIDMSKDENNSAEFLSKNPFGKLPILELDDGTIIAESMAIIRYFDALQAQPKLLGHNALERAQIEMWNRRMELELAYPIAHCFQHTHAFWQQRIEQIPAYGEQCRNKVYQRMQWLNEELAQREYIGADRYTMADITAQCGLILGKVCDLRIPEQLAHLNRWFTNVTGRATARA